MRHRSSVQQGRSAIIGALVDITERKAAEQDLKRLTAILDEEELYKEFFFEPGQIQLVNNQRIGHKRTAFEDWPEPDRRRHLVRIWLRQDGRRFYNG